jgi:abortive infection bacteriophage resistance protein
VIKTFKTIEEQIEILKSKGLVINYYEDAKEILLRENYFFVSGYRHLFMKSSKDRMFITGTTFEELYALFNFDRQLRNVFFKNLLIIENNCKSIFSYQMSKKYGIKEKNYLNPANFDQSSDKNRQINDLLKKIKRQIRINGGQHTATMHYITNYGFVPFWVVVKVLSFGLISELYTVMKREDQKEVAIEFGISADELATYLPLLANFRNLCAHEDIMYDHKTQRRIDNTKYHSMLEIPVMDGDYIYGKDDIFALVIILKQLLRDDDFHAMINEIAYEVDILSGKLNSIDVSKVLDAMGFPENYKEIMRMD